MKQKALKIFALLTVFSFLISCSNDKDISNEITNAENVNSVQLVQIMKDKSFVIVGNKRLNTRSNAEIDSSNYALKFSSEKEHQNMISRFKTMSHKEKLAYTDSIGLISLQKLLEIADNELDNIGNKSVNENDFREKYKRYKEKYARYFIFNEYDSEDLSPYIPDGDINASYLVGISHSIVINNNIDNIKFNNEMSQSDKILFASNLPLAKNNVLTRSLAPESEWPTNSFIQKDGSRKTIFSISSYYENVTVHFGAQKKMWYGWKRDPNRDFYLKINFSNFEYFTKTEHGQVIWYNYPADLYSYIGTGGLADIKFGRFSGNYTSSTGRAFVWTDVTIDYETINGIKLPKGLIEKSIPCQIKLVRN
jgi:hypothetical protein